LIPGSGDHDLTPRQNLNHVNHPGANSYTLFSPKETLHRTPIYKTDQNELFILKKGKRF